MKKQRVSERQIVTILKSVEAWRTARMYARSMVSAMAHSTHGRANSVVWKRLIQTHVRA